MEDAQRFGEKLAEKEKRKETGGDKTTTKQTVTGSAFFVNNTEIF